MAVAAAVVVPSWLQVWQVGRAGECYGQAHSPPPNVSSGPLTGSSLLQSLPEKGSSDPARLYLAWRGLRPSLASWAWVQASWLAGIQASASFLGTLKEQGPPRSSILGPKTTSLQPRAKKRVWATRAQAAALTPGLGLPRPCLPMLLGQGDPGWVSGPTLTHGVAALLHGPDGAPSFHSAAQSPSLLQILKRQKPQVIGSELERWESWEGLQSPSGVGARVGRRVCDSHPEAWREDWLEEVV